MAVATIKEMKYESQQRKGRRQDSDATCILRRLELGKFTFLSEGKEQ